MSGLLKHLAKGNKVAAIPWVFHRMNKSLILINQYINDGPTGKMLAISA
ncbi:hypothetical protein [Pantoea agglomerans]